MDRSKECFFFPSLSRLMFRESWRLSCLNGRRLLHNHGRIHTVLPYIVADSSIAVNKEVRDDAHWYTAQ